MPSLGLPVCCHCYQGRRGLSLTHTHVLSHWQDSSSHMICIHGLPVRDRESLIVGPTSWLVQAIWKYLNAEAGNDCLQSDSLNISPCAHWVVCFPLHGRQASSGKNKGICSLFCSLCSPYAGRRRNSIFIYAPMSPIHLEFNIRHQFKSAPTTTVIKK